MGEIFKEEGVRNVIVHIHPTIPRNGVDVFCNGNHHAMDAHHTVGVWGIGDC